MEDGSSLMAQWVKNAGDTGDSGSTSGLGSSPGGRHGNSLQYSCLENPHGQRSLEGYHPWGCKESDTTESKHSSSIMFLSKSFVSVTIMIPLIKPRFHSESLQLFWLPNPSIASFFGKISALCWICYYIRICMLRNSEKNAQPHELRQQSYAS